MSDLISRSALIERMNYLAAFCATYKPYMSKDDIAEKVLKQAKEQALRLVIEAPTVDAKPVIHGEWQPYKISKIFSYTCNVCHCDVEEKSPFCPHCGAKMDDYYSRKHLEDVRDGMKKTGLTNEEMEGYFFGKKVQE